MFTVKFNIFRFDFDILIPYLTLYNSLLIYFRFRFLFFSFLSFFTCLSFHLIGTGKDKIGTLQNLDEIIDEEEVWVYTEGDR